MNEWINAEQIWEWADEIERRFATKRTWLCQLTLSLLVLTLSSSSVQFSGSVMYNSLRPHELQHARPPCPSPTPRVHSDSRPLSWWCHPAISSYVVPFSSCPQSLPESGSFPMSQLFTWGDQSIGVSALASVLPKNTQDWSPCSPRDSQESSPTPQFKSIISSALSFLYSPTLTSIHDYWKNCSLKLCGCWVENIRLTKSGHRRPVRKEQCSGLGERYWCRMKMQ